jgi:putative copper resistance protein D
VEAELGLLQRAVTVILNLSFAVLVGGSAASLWLRAAQSPWAAALLPRLRRALLAASGAALLAHVAILWVEAASMAEVPLAEALPAVGSVLSATHYGLAWMIGAAALAVTAASCATGLHAPAIRIAALGVLLYSRSMVSHAGAAGDFGWAIAVDWVHLVLTSIWVGEVIVAGLLALRPLPNDDAASRSDCAHYVAALSRSATVALAGIVVTGAISAWRVLDSPADLVGNPYGGTLLVKLALVLCAAALGGANRFLVMPALLAALQGAGQPQRMASRRFARILQLEAAILLGVLIAAAFLTSTPPPMADGTIQ